MEIYHLTAFAAVAETGNLTRAAENLHISPSALSAHIKGLEEETGLKLFQRAARGMTLTDCGEKLLPRANAALSALTRFKVKAGSLAGTGTVVLRIGLNASPQFLKMSAISARLAQEFPRVQVRFIKSDTPSMAQRLRRGEIDLGFMFTHRQEQIEESALQIDPLADVEMCVVIPPAFLNPNGELSWEQAVQLPWIWAEKNVACHAAFKRQLSKRGLSLNTVTYASDDGIIQQLVADGQGAAIMRHDVAQRLALANRARIWSKGTVTVSLGLAYPVEKTFDPSFCRVRGIISELWQTRS